MLCHFKSLLCRSGLLWLAQVPISHVFFTSTFDGFASPSNTDFDALTTDTVCTRDFYTQFAFYRSKHVNILDT